MRIRLEKGKQKELILLAKGNESWKKLASFLDIDAHYISYELKNESNLISYNIYQKLCLKTKKNFDGYIKEKLNDYWGQSLGSRNSKGSLLDIKIPQRDEKLAEIIGAILGDGNVTYYKKGKKIGVYQVNITGHKILDENYHIVYLKNLFEELFRIKSIQTLSKKSNARHLIISSKKVVEFFINEGLKSGSKIRNQSTIPNWIKENNNYLKACLRGLIDTDGSIFKMSNQDPKLLRISLTNYNQTLLQDSRSAFIKLDFHPSKIIKEKQIFLSKKSDITKYLKEIGFSNEKHLRRVKSLVV